MDNVVSSKELSQLTNSLGNVLEGGDDFTQTLTKLLSLPEEEFAILSPGILQAYQQSLNNPSDKLAIVQMLNAMGGTADDMIEIFNGIDEAVQDLSISAQKRDFLKEMVAAVTNAVNDTEGIAKRIVPIGIELCHENAKIPQYAHISDSGMDVYALEDITVKPGETVLVSTGIKLSLPPGFEIQVRPKSGRALKTKLRIANTPGTIDQEYRDEIKVIIENVDPPIKDITIDDNGKVTSILYGSNYTIGKGEKFCQFVLAEVPKAAMYVVESVKELGEDRGGGFGSSGIK